MSVRWHGGRSRAAILLCIVLCIAACTDSQERFADHMARAEDYLDGGQTKEAILEFQSALSIHPDDAALHERIGHAFYLRNRFAEAMPYFEQAYLLDDSRLRAAMYQARLIALYDRPRAKELLARGLAEAPELDVVHRTASYIAALEGDVTGALEAAERAVQLGPEDIENWIQLAEVRDARIVTVRRQGRQASDEMFEEAIAALDEADRLRGGFPRARLEKARLLTLWPGHRQLARPAYLGALELAKQGGVPIEIRLAVRAVDQYGVLTRDFPLRRTAWRALVDAIEDDYEAWNRLGVLSGRNGEEIYLELLDKRPRDPRSYLLYSQFLMRTDRPDDAEAQLRQAIQDGVDEAVLWDQLLRMKLSQGDLPASRAIYVEMSERHPKARATKLAEARLALTEGRPEDAAEHVPGLLTRDLKEGRNSYEVFRLLALAELRNRKAAAAWDAIVRAEELAPASHAPTLKLKARIAAELGDWRTAVRSLRAVVENREKISDDERVLLARGLYRLGRPSAGRVFLDELLEAPRPHPKAVVAFAELEGEREPERAHELLLEAHERVPAHADVLEALVTLEVERGEAELAMERLNQVIAARRATPRILLLRARLLTGAGAYEQAEADVLRAFEADPLLPGAIDLLFAIYQAQDRIAEARRSFEQAEEAGVLHTGARLLLARLYLADGDTERAREMLEHVIEEQPELWTAKNDLAWLLVEQGQDLARARQLAGEADRGSGHGADTSDTLGYVNLKAGQHQLALAQFRRAIARARDEGEVRPTFRYHLGLALLALGRDDEAANAFEMALGQGEFPEAEDARRQLEAARHPEAESASQG